MDSMEAHQSSPPSCSTPPPNITMPPSSFSPALPNPITSSLINPNSSPILMAQPLPVFPSPYLHHSPVHSYSTYSFFATSKPSEPLRTTTPYEGSSSALRPCGLSIDSPKKRRGQPRRYSSNGSATLDLGPMSLSSFALVDLSPTSDEPPAKRSRGRPLGSRKKQLDALD